MTGDTLAAIGLAAMSAVVSYIAGYRRNGSESRKMDAEAAETIGEAWRALFSRIEAETNQLRNENNILKKEVDELKGVVSRLEIMVRNKEKVEGEVVVLRKQLEESGRALSAAILDNTELRNRISFMLDARKAEIT